MKGATEKDEGIFANFGEMEGEPMQIQQEKHRLEIICRVGHFPKWDNFHWHENYEICQLLSESGSFLVDGKLIQAKKGDLIVIGGSVVHSFLPDGHLIAVRVVRISPRILLDENCPSAVLQTHIPWEQVERISGLAEWMNALFPLMEKESPLLKGDEKPLLRHFTMSLYLLLVKYFSVEELGPTQKGNEEFRRIVEYVNAHFWEEDLSVERLAKEMYLSREKLSDLFHRYAGMSVKTYWNTLRIEQVNRLLQEGNDISRAALESGFRNLRTFNDVYKKLTGKTPSEYRDQKNKR